MRPEGPKGHWLLGAAVDFKKDPLGFFVNTAKDYPNITSFKFGPRNMYLLSNPDYIKHVLQTNNKNYRKGTKYRELAHFLGNGLLTSEGDYWRKQRRLSQPSFKREKIEGFAQTMIDYTYQMIDEWKVNKKGKDFDLLNEMMALTLRIIGQTMLSVDFKGSAKKIGDSISILIEATNERIQTVINPPIWLPIPKHLKFKNEKKYIDKVMYKLINDRRIGKVKKEDLLDMLLSAIDEETGEGMNDEQLRDELATIFVAGHETTAIALTWSLYLISQNPDVQEKIKQEVQNVTKGERVKVSDFYQFEYTMMVAEEAMRLYPPAWIMARKALDDDEIDGHKIYKGDDILMSIYQMHRDERFWENALKFDPERFSKENKSKHHKFAYFPFGGGPRLCIGQYFALMEMQIIISIIYNELAPQLAKGFKPEPYPLVTLRPNKMMMNIQ